VNQYCSYITIFELNIEHRLAHMLDHILITTPSNSKTTAKMVPKHFSVSRPLYLAPAVIDIIRQTQAEKKNPTILYILLFQLLTIIRNCFNYCSIPVRLTQKGKGNKALGFNFLIMIEYNLGWLYGTGGVFIHD